MENWNAMMSALDSVQSAIEAKVAARREKIRNLQAKLNAVMQLRYAGQGVSTRSMTTRNAALNHLYQEYLTIAQTARAEHKTVEVFLRDKSKNLDQIMEDTDTLANAQEKELDDFLASFARSCGVSGGKKSKAKTTKKNVKQNK